MSLPNFRDYGKVQRSFSVWTAYYWNHSREINVLVGAASFGKDVLVFCFVVLSLPGFERGSDQIGKTQKLSHVGVSSQRKLNQ